MKKFILLLLISLLTFNFMYAQKQIKSDILLTPKNRVSKMSGKSLTGPVNLMNSLNLGATYLRMSQADITEDNAGNGNPDNDNQTGGWYWYATYPTIYNTGVQTFGNLYGVTALGLYYDYLKTGNAQIFTALTDAMNGLMSIADARSGPNLYLLIKYNELPGVTGTSYKNEAKARFDYMIQNHGGTATSFAQYLRDYRAASYHNGIIPWDIAGYILAAKALDNAFPSQGYSAMAQDFAEVLYQDSYNNNPGYFKPTGGQNNGWDPTYNNSNYWWYTLGISGLMDAFYLTNTHTDKLPELKTILLSSQVTSGDTKGAFCGSYGIHENDEEWQSTAYAVMSLARIDQTLNLNSINNACNYLVKSQDASGAWIYSDNTHYPEVGAENTSALYFGRQTSLYVDDDYTESSCGGHIWGFDAFNKIQDAINAASTGSVINVYPGNYDEFAPNSTPVSIAGTYQFGLFIHNSKSGITIQGVNASGIPITNYNNIVANVQLNATDNFGPDGMFIEADNVTISGLKLWQNISLGTNKTITIIGDNLTFKYNHVTDVTTDGPWGSLYIGDELYNSVTNTSHIQSYTIANNYFDNCSIDINNGAGYSGPVSGRKILNNDIKLGAWAGASISFTGSGTGVPWFIHGTGGAIITGNNFRDNTQHIRVRGDYDNSQFDWSSYWTQNVFDKAVICGANPPANVREYSYASGEYTMNHVRRIGALIQGEIDHALANDIVKINSGLYPEAVNVNKTITVSGVDRDQVIIKGPKTAGTGQTMILAAPGILLEKVTITRDGNNLTDWVTNGNNSGLAFAQGIMNSTVQNVKVTENRNGIYINNSQGNTIKNCIVTNNRTGIQLVNNVSNVLIENNDITNNWTMGFVLYYNGVTTPSTNCLIKNNNITGNWYSCLDCKTVGANPTTSYDFRNNWWGSYSLNVVTTPAGEPAYDAQIPVQFGGTAVSPGGNDGKISGDLSGKILYDPWIGKAEVYNVTNDKLNQDIIFSGSNAKANFSVLAPSTLGTLSIQRLFTPPVGVSAPPASAGNVAPIYLDINATGLPNQTFNCTITIDVSNIPNFAAGTKVMFYSTSTNTWVGMEGTYDAVAKTYSFVTNHFTLFAFVNPLNPDAVYMAMDKDNPITTMNWYPNVNMNNPIVGSPDWKYTGINTSFYIVPTGTQSFYSTKFYIEWDKSKLPNYTVEAGNMFDGGFFFTRDLSAGNSGKVEVNYASANLNVVPGAGKYLAKINFTGMQPGYTSVSMTGADFRYYQEDSQSNVYITANDGKVFFYLGDIAKAGDQTVGDGKINIEDVSLFTSAYWSTVGGANYKYKYDIGPTNSNGSYFALPNSDGKIEFEDLCIFSIGYGKYAAGQLPQETKSPLRVTLESISLGSDGYLRAPVKLSGNVSDVRALSLDINKSNGLEYVGVETQGQLQELNGFIIGKSEGNKVNIDAAVIGELDGLNREGIIANVIFRQTGNQQIVGFNNVLARNSGNNPIGVKFDKDGGLTNGLPTTFDLAQNYPNPFNPQTTINYQLPKDVFVAIKIYDMLGREVAMLVNQAQKAGYYSIVWNASQVSSGIYFYKITAGDFSSIKKMVVLK